MIVPQRTCIGCRQVKAKHDLIRIVRSPDGKTITVDPRGKEKGRGAYVCPNLECVNKAMQPEKLDRAFLLASDSTDDRISPEIVDRLRQNLLGWIKGGKKDTRR